MSESPVEAATAAPGEKRSAGPPWAKASESGDPAVQKLLGDRHTAEQNAAAAAGDADTAEAVRSAHEAHVAATNEALHDLGFE